MATGGLGGVHRDAHESYDESADPHVTVAQSSARRRVGCQVDPRHRRDARTTSIPWAYRSRATERTGSLASTSATAGFALDWALDDEVEAAAAFLIHSELSSTGFLVANPVSKERELSRDQHDGALASALERAKSLGVTGKEVTPVLLAEFARYTEGESVEVNRHLVVANAGPRRANRDGDRQESDVTPRRILVIGDVMLDVVVKPMTAVAPTSDTPARVRLSRGGSAANMAVAPRTHGTPRDIPGREW